MLVTPERCPLRAALDEGHERFGTTVGEVIASASGACPASVIRLASKFPVTQPRNLATKRLAFWCAKIEAGHQRAAA